MKNRLTKLQKKTLNYILISRWITHSNLVVLYGHSSNAKKHIDALINKRLLNSTIVKLSFNKKTKLYYLNSNGLFNIASLDVYKSYSLFYPSKLSDRMFYHSYMCRDLLARIVNAQFSDCALLDYSNKINNKGMHYPDLSGVYKGDKFAFEVELFMKSYDRYLEIFGFYIKQLSNNQLDFVVYKSSNDKLLIKIENLFNRIEVFRFKGEEFKCPPSIKKRFLFINNEFFRKLKND